MHEALTAGDGGGADLEAGEREAGRAEAETTKLEGLTLLGCMRSLR